VVGRNAHTAIDQAQLIGAIKMLAYSRDIPVFGISNTTAKKALTGSGRADKAEMVAAAQGIAGEIGGTKVQREAVADAIGIALAGYRCRVVAETREEG
jgi:Holliday junction resolvasome RuvABC endonuclease subunit